VSSIATVEGRKVVDASDEGTQRKTERRGYREREREREGGVVGGRWRMTVHKWLSTSVNDT